MPSTNLPPHFYTYGSATCKFSSDSDAPVVFLRQKPRPGDPQIYPCSILLTRVEQWTFFFVLVCLGHSYMENQSWAYFTKEEAPVDPQREFPQTGPGFY